MNLIKYSSLALVFSLTTVSQARAGEMTIPNTFTANSPAIATEVNANFTAAKTAIDTNYNEGVAAISVNASAITTNADDIDNNESAISVMEGDVNDNTTDLGIIKTGILSIHGGLCRTKNPDQLATLSSSAKCKLTDNANSTMYWGYFPISLPDGVNITDFVATVSNASTYTVACYLKRKAHTAEAPETSIADMRSDANITKAQTIIDSTIRSGAENVANDSHSYIAYCGSNDAAGDGLVYSIRVKYEFP